MRILSEKDLAMIALESPSGFTFAEDENFLCLFKGNEEVAKFNTRVLDITQIEELIKGLNEEP